MATLTAIEFPTADGADRALRTLEDLQKQRLIVVHDAAVVSWPSDKKQPKTRQLHNLVGAGALGGMFWGNCGRRRCLSGGPPHPDRGS